MIVIGGTYLETTDCPDHRAVAGSGLRAAGAIATRGDVILHTAIDDGLADESAVIAAGLGVRFDAVPRDQAVGFRYFTALSSPVIDGPGARCEDPLEGDDEAALVFGMIEQSTRSVTARQVVLDPQRPRDLVGVSRDGIAAERLALVCNRSEVRAIGGSDDLETAALAAGASVAADVVVVKRGAVGCSIFHGGSITHVGAHPTRTVWPIGSGDVFAAGFTHAWGSGADPVEAARVGSAAAAWWCGTRNPTVPGEILSGGRLTDSRISTEQPLVERPLVYLAGPFFCLAERWLIETTRDALRGLGADVFSPLHDVGAGGDEVAAKDLAGLDAAGSVLALVDGFDAGTLYECGWARHANIPVIAFGAEADAEGAKMLVGDGAELHADFASAVYRSVWAAMGAPTNPGRIPGPTV